MSSFVRRQLNQGSWFLFCIFNCLILSCSLLCTCFLSVSVTLLAISELRTTCQLTDKFLICHYTGVNAVLILNTVVCICFGICVFFSEPTFPVLTDRDFIFCTVKLF